MKTQSLIVFLLLWSVTGCGKNATVSGTVTINGEPAKNGGAVSFHPENGPTAIGQIDSHGRYTLAVGTDQRLPPGNYKVTVIGYGEPLPWVNKNDAPPAPPVVTNLKYRNLETTPLTRTVVAGDNKFDFEVEAAEK